MRRRDVISGLLSVPLAGCMADLAVPPRGLPLWLVTKGRSRVFLLGFGDAKDTRTWMTPALERAFHQSSELWLETRSLDASDDRGAPANQPTAEQMERLGRTSERTLFEVLEPRVAERTLAYMDELGIQREIVEKLLPWRAYYVVVAAFWSRRTMSHTTVDVDTVLAGMARNAGKHVGYEMPSSTAFFQFMAALSEKAQSQYVEWLLDYLDDFKTGINTEESSLGWISGNQQAALRSLERMRKQMPELYRVMQVQRNKWWARKIDTLLRTPGIYFVAVGQLHVLGPDGIPRLLDKMGIAAHRYR